MNNFTQFLTECVAEAQAQMEAEERAEKALGKVQVHKDIDYLADMYNRMEKLEKDASRVKVDVLGGYDRMSKSNYRFAHKLARKNKVSDDSYFNYLLASQGIENKIREDKKVTESYAFDFSDSVDNLPWKKVAKTTTSSRAVVKEQKTLPKASYLPSKLSASTTKYTAEKILRQDGKTPIYSRNFDFYKVVDFKINKMAVVLEIHPVDTIAHKKWTEDEIIGLQKEGLDSSRDREEVNQMTTHLVFRYEPLTKSGKPNPYCGLEQLKNWLKSQDFITRQAPATLKDALEVLKGYTVSIPRAYAYNYTEKSDNLTVYTVFGDFTDFEESFI